MTEKYTSRQRQAMIGAYRKGGNWVSDRIEDQLIDRGVIAYSESRGDILTPWGMHEAARMIEEENTNG